MSNWVKVKGFTITQNKDSTFRVRYKDSFRRYQIDRVSYKNALEFCLGLCDDKDKQPIKLKMREKWKDYINK